MPGVAFDDLLTQPIAMFDGIDVENYIIATYITQLRPKQLGIVMGQFAAIEQSTGTWIKVPAETAEVRKKHVAKVIGCYELPHWEYEIPKGTEHRNYVIQLAFPINRMNPSVDLEQDSFLQKRNYL